MTAEQALSALQDGNHRFVTGRRKHPNCDPERRQVTASQGQNPFATVLTCSDSRVPVEHVFDTGIGDLFEIQVAGNVCGELETASVEYAVWELKTPLVLVLGHTHCGAVTAAVNRTPATGALKALVNRIEPALAEAVQQAPNEPAAERLARTTWLNVHRSIEDMLLASPIIRAAVREGRTKIFGALYDIEQGTVTGYEEHPRQLEWAEHR